MHHHPFLSLFLPESGFRKVSQTPPPPPSQDSNSNAGRSSVSCLQSVPQRALSSVLRVPRPLPFPASLPGRRENDPSRSKLDHVTPLKILQWFPVVFGIKFKYRREILEALDGPALTSAGTSPGQSFQGVSRGSGDFARVLPLYSRNTLWTQTYLEVHLPLCLLP